MHHILFIGTTMMVGSLALTVLLFGVAARAMAWVTERGWLHQGTTPHLVFNLIVALIWIIFVLTLSVWAWALLYMHLGLFDELEPALYFSVVSFTTVGFGDIVLEPGFRLYAGMTATHGLLIFGLFTAFLIEILKRSRPNNF
ncbi:MAG: ion channel [Pseudomonadota bacterium]